MSEKNRVKLKICGYEFTVSSESSEEYIRRTADAVDDHIRRLMEYSPQMSTSMGAVLAAMDFCDEACRAKETADNLRAQIKEYFDEAAAARAEAEEWKKKAQAAGPHPVPPADAPDAGPHDDRGAQHLRRGS